MQVVAQPAVLNQKVDLKIVKGKAQVTRHPQRVMPTKRKVFRTQRVVTSPGDQYHTTYVNQPIIDREFVNVQVQKAPTKVVRHEAVVEPTVTKTRVKRRVVNVPGDLLINQKHIKPTTITEQVNVRIEKQADEHETKQAIVKRPIRTKTVEKRFHTAPFVIPVDKVVHVPVPVVTKIPVFLGTKTQIFGNGGLGLNLGGAGLATGLSQA